MGISRICLAGKNRIAVDALLFMVERGFKDYLMVCPNRGDDGNSNWQPSLLRFARELGVEIVNLAQAKQVPDILFLSLEFDRIIRPGDFCSSRLFNLHFSALPAYKGMYTSALPILHGQSHTGVTLHKIDAGIDTGPILGQTIFELCREWTARDLYFAYMDHGLALFRKYFDELVAIDTPSSTPQPAIGASYYGKNAIDYANLKINLRDTADGIVRQLRAFSFREYQTPVIDDMEIGDWEILPERSFEPPGSVLERDSDGMTLATIDYRIRLRRSRVWEWFDVTAHSPIDKLDPAQIDIRDRNGWTPLIRSAWAGDYELCRRLLEAGADPNYPNCNGTTPLMYALSGRNPKKVAEVLLAFGADPHQRDLFGRSLTDYHPRFRTSQL